MGCFQGVAEVGSVEGLVAAGVGSSTLSATVPGVRLKYRTRKFNTSGSLSDSSSSVKRQVNIYRNNNIVKWFFNTIFDDYFMII